MCIATGKHFFWADDRYIRFIVFPAVEKEGDSPAPSQLPGTGQDA